MSKRVLQAFGRRVRQLRSERGWSQERLAEECGLHRTYVGGIERGERNVSLVNIEKIASALGVSIAELFKIGRGGRISEARLDSLTGEQRVEPENDRRQVSAPS